MSEVSDSPRTPAPDLLLIAFRALNPTEQEEAYQLINEARLARLAGDDSEYAQLLADLRTVAEVLGEAPGIDDYKRIRRELEAEGRELAPVSRVLKHFNGSWHLAKEALGMSEYSSARKVEARLASRKLGKIWRYTDQTLGQVVADCVADLGHLPQVAEFNHWRQRKTELAKARGEELHLPSAGPYRRRWRTWENALLAFGYSEEEVAGRLERE